MKKTILEIFEGKVEQSTSEELAYTITTTNWVGSPTSPVLVVFDADTDEDVTSTVMPTNSPSVSTDTITLSLLKSLTKGHTYRLELKFNVSTNVYECLMFVKCVA